jgi:hypothetical protein
MEGSAREGRNYLHPLLCCDLLNCPKQKPKLAVANPSGVLAIFKQQIFLSVFFKKKLLAFEK